MRDSDKLRLAVKNAIYRIAAAYALLISVYAVAAKKSIVKPK